jgi:hypothetical protein
MAKHTANDFTQDEYGQLAELARGVYWARSLFHGALEVVQQRYPKMVFLEQERLARRVAAITRAQLRQGRSP